MGIGCTARDISPRAIGLGTQKQGFFSLALLGSASLFAIADPVVALTLDATPSLVRRSTVIADAHFSDGTDLGTVSKPQFSGPLGGDAVTINGYQYVVYYTAKNANGDAKVRVSRRAQDSATWSHATLSGYNVRSEDTHNRPVIGVSGDGRIHITFDHHAVTVLRYANTAKGVATNPGSTTWNDAVLTYRPNLGLNNIGGRTVTYPEFTRRGNNLILYFRDGGDQDGRMTLVEYDSTTGWKPITTIGSWDGTFNSPQGPSTRRGVYHGGFVTDANGTLHVAWVHRERDNCASATNELSCNHGLFFAYSSDGGKQWKQNNGATIRGVMTVNNVGGPVRNIPQALWPNNSNISNTIDLNNNQIHTVIQQRPNASNSNDRMFHYLRNTAGGWFTRDTGVDMSRPRIAFLRGNTAADDALIAFSGSVSGSIWYVKRGSGTTANFAGAWRQITLPAGLSMSGGYYNWDFSRLNNNGIVSLIWQKSKDAAGKSPIEVIDLDLAT